ncbi:MAG: hypothetical protein Q8R18_06080, partial [bacterium]|nr:hypothetical protein [bacterium]
MKRGIVIVLFIISLVTFVYAENGCCGETFSGESCRYTSEENCATVDYFDTSACEEVSWCGSGCCVSAEGGCAEGAGDYSCTLIGGDYFSAQACSSVPSCEKVCCQLNSDYLYVNQAACDLQSAETGITTVIHDADSESDCYALEREDESGCCVTGDGCSASSGGDCETLEFDSATGYGFYSNDACSDVSDYLESKSLAAAEDCQCVNEGQVVCSEDLFYVQSVDSCENVGDIVDECSYPNEICSTASGTAACVETSCSYSFPEELDDYNYEDLSGTAENGESWCVYESPAGNYQDRPGSQHYVASCYAGEILFEACGDYRSEVCVQDKESGLRQADCVTNTVDNVDGEITTVPIGENFWEYYNSADTTASSCSGGVVNCNVLMGKDSTVDFAYECDANCFCLRKEWSLLMAEYCKSQGDCGNDLNLVGRFTDGSFNMKRERDEVGYVYKTDIGCGENCIYDNDNSNSVIWDAVGLQCYPGGSLADCKFYTWNWIDASYKESLLVRSTGSVSLFTLWEYVGILPQFFHKASEYEKITMHDDGQVYSDVTASNDEEAVNEILEIGLDYPDDELLYYYGESSGNIPYYG